jgi:protease-4
MEKMGINVEVVKAGKFKDIGSAVRPLTEKERQILESFAGEIHQQFIKDVAAGRRGKISLEKLREIADGSFFTGEKAKEWGLVDTLGNFYDAVTIAAELGGIKVDPELVYPKKKWDSYLDLFLESVGKALVRMADKSPLLEFAPSIR